MTMAQQPSSSSNVIMENAFHNGGHCVESALSICCIVGRDWGLTCKHANANLIASATSLAT